MAQTVTTADKEETMAEYDGIVVEAGPDRLLTAAYRTKPDIPNTHTVYMPMADYARFFRDFSHDPHRIIQRDERRTKPQGEFLLTMSTNDAVRQDLLHFLDSIRKAA